MNRPRSRRRWAIRGSALLALLVGSLAWILSETRGWAAGPPEPDARAHRAYDGAPPVIPHPVSELGRGDCLSCHLRGLDAQGSGRAPRTPHPELPLCEQCHVESHDVRPFRESTFVGGSYRGGERQHSAAPWLVPHPFTMRENCLACHGPDSPEATRTSHPERVRCRQCHMPAYAGWPGERPVVGME